MKPRLLTTFVAGILAMASAPGALAQDDRPPPPPLERGDDLSEPIDPIPPGGPESPVTPEKMRENLRRQLDRNARERKAVEAAMVMLDQGKPVEEVREHLREVMRDGLRDRGQQLREARRQRPMGDGPPQRREPGADAPPPPSGAGPRPLERLLGVLHETNPKMAERFERLRRENPEQFQRLFDDFAPRLARLAEERERFPDRWPDRVKQLLLQQRAGALAREIADLPPEQQAEQVEKLRANLGEQFDIRLKFAREDLARNKEQAQRLEREIGENSGDKAAAVERHMREMLERAKDR
jgi:hypothetical protein